MERTVVHCYKNDMWCDLFRITHFINILALNFCFLFLIGFITLKYKAFLLAMSYTFYWKQNEIHFLYSFMHIHNICNAVLSLHFLSNIVFYILWNDAFSNVPYFPRILLNFLSEMCSGISVFILFSLKSEKICSIQKLS